MKKLLHYADRLTVVTAAAGVLLRLWLRQVGPDGKGLYPAAHISWILLLVLTIAVAVLLFMIARHAGRNRSYFCNFQASGVAAAGCAAGAGGMLFTAMGLLPQRQDVIDLLLIVLGFAAGAALLYNAWCRLRGLKPHYIAHLLPCLFLAVRVFSLGRQWGDDPEPVHYLMGFLATVTAMLASYNLWGFDVELGNRSASLLWSLLAVFLSCTAVAEGTEPMLYACLALWLMTNLCPLDAPPEPAEAPAAPYGELESRSDEEEPAAEEQEYSLEDILKEFHQEEAEQDL